MRRLERFEGGRGGRGWIMQHERERRKVKIIGENVRQKDGEACE